MDAMKHKIIVDTREQKPIFKGCNVIRRKLDEGDYTTDALEEYIVIERKSPGDLYGSLVQGHVRFLDEILRARFKNKKFYVVVECSEIDFITKNFVGGYYLRLPPKVIASILHTVKEKYCVIFIWCNGRSAVKSAILDIIKINNKLYNII